MKDKIHPKTQKTVITCSCGAKFELESTKKDMRIEVCSQCHPFYTGNRQRIGESRGQVEKFRRKYGLKKDS